MDRVLAKYKDRLINISGRNRSFVMKRIYKKRAFDLKRIDYLTEKRTPLLLQHLMEQAASLFPLVEEPFHYRQEQEKMVEKEFLQRRKEELGGAQDLEREKEAIELALKREQEARGKQIAMLFNAQVENQGRLKYLMREIEATEKESGRYELYVGYPFVEGTLWDGTFVRAPLMLFPVRVKKHKGGDYLENILDNDIQLNKVFVYACCKCNDLKLPQMSFQYPNPKEIPEGLVPHVLEQLKEAGITISSEAGYNLEVFPEYLAGTTPLYDRGQLVLKGHLILGQFPISNSIYNDYEELETLDLGQDLRSMLTSCDSLHGAVSKLEEEEYLSEKELNVLSTLDYSQEQAVKRASEKQLVIYGPPGTGKSETIVNIIADHLAKGQRVLMVSQKRASLDVVYNRLGVIKDKLVVIHDANKGKGEFYTKISESIAVAEQGSPDSQELPVKKLATAIDAKIAALEKNAQELHAPRAFGLTLRQMYGMCQAIPENPRLEERILALKKSNPFSSTGYRALHEARERLLEGPILQAFLEMKSFLAASPLLSYLPFHLQRIDILSALRALEQETVEQTWHTLQEMKSHGGYRTLVACYKEQGISCLEDGVLRIASMLTQELHGELLQPLAPRRWWSLGYWLHYGTIKKQEEENKNRYGGYLEGIKDELRSIVQVVTQVPKRLEELAVVFGEKGLQEIVFAVLSQEESASEVFVRVQTALHHSQDYGEVLSRLGPLSTTESQLLEYCYGTGPKNEGELKEAVWDTVEATIPLGIRDIESSFSGKLPILSQRDFAREVEATRKLMKEKQELIPTSIRRTWLKKLPMHTTSYKEFKRQASKKRQLLPVRAFLKQYSTEVLNLVPCWLMGPETVSDILPLQKDLFDVVIFDEASQMFIENALPSMFRGKKTVIAGDDKQLRPSSQFLARYNELDEEEEFSLEYAAAVEEESLLDVAKITYPSVCLNYHYRSLYEELITFSNHAFYGGRLQVSPNIGSYEEPAIERIKVKGMWTDRRTNIEEAERVVELVKEILFHRKHNETLGVITFNISQRDAIEDALDEATQSDLEFRAAYYGEQNRTEGDQDVSFFVKNIENVQGDERDIIIFSIGYAPNSKGHLAVRFGSLSQEGGENRLNVAVSRARRKVYVITSIEPEDLNVEGTKNPGPKYLKKYLEYARAIAEGRDDETKILLASLRESAPLESKEVPFGSAFEEEVYKVLESRGYRVDREIGALGYRIDLAVFCPTRKRYILGIECEGSTHGSFRSARARDLNRNRYLESRGWRMLRIASRDWWQDRMGQIQRIEEALEYRAKVAQEQREERPKSVEQDPLADTPDLRVTSSSSYFSLHGKAKKEQESVVSYGDTVKVRALDTEAQFVVTLGAKEQKDALAHTIEQELLERQKGMR